MKTETESTYKCAYTRIYSDNCQSRQKMLWREFRLGTYPLQLTVPLIRTRSLICTVGHKKSKMTVSAAQMNQYVRQRTHCIGQ
jgi:hypothetical protein